MAVPEAVEILLVEDNDIDAELTLRALKLNHLSNKLLRLVDGQEALDYLLPQSSSPDAVLNINPTLILLDLNLPKISGLEVLTIIKNDLRTKKIPVVVLTSSSEDQDIAECFQLGANSYIVKPVEFEKFIEAVQQLGLYWVLLNQHPS